MPAGTQHSVNSSLGSSGRLGDEESTTAKARSGYNKSKVHSNNVHRELSKIIINYKQTTVTRGISKEISAGKPISVSAPLDWTPVLVLSHRLCFSFTTSTYHLLTPLSGSKSFKQLIRKPKARRQGER